LLVGVRGAHVSGGGERGRPSPRHSMRSRSTAGHVRANCAGCRGTSWTLRTAAFASCGS
jgi:hypothetical protein